MATLEVHDAQGKVERVTISRDNPVVFGANPKCDIVLTGEGVLPFHGRLRWKGSKFKVDASPEARYVEVNGHKMTTSSFHQGDEIQIGLNRIFMINPDDAPPEDDRTRVQPAPAAAPAKGAKRSRRPRPGKPEAASPGPRGGPATPPPVPGPSPVEPRLALDRDDWLGDLEPPPPSAADVALAELEPPRPKKPPKPRRALSGVFRAFSGRDVAPGQEKILSSPLVLGLVACLAALVAAGFALRAVIAETVATRTFNRATESYDQGDYRNAIRRFDEFLAARPRDKRSSQARVLRALADVRQFTSTTGASWSNALEAEAAMYDTVREEPAYRDASAELDDLILRTGEMLADRARGSADEKALTEAEAAVALHARVVGGAAADLLKRSPLPSKLARARAAVKKEQARVRALAAMDAAVKAGSSRRVYAARDGLVRRYPDLADDRGVVERLGRANELIRRAVGFDPARRPAETSARPEPLGPPTSLVLRSSREARAATGPTVFALADGAAYAVDGASGAPLWQRSLGESSPFPPQPIPGGSTVLAVDARFDELVRLEGRTGKLLWRLGLGEPVRHPPLVLGNQIIQATPGGKVLLVDLASGQLQGTFSLGLPLTQSPVVDETGQYLYVLAKADCLFVLTRDPAGCAAVEYLGHRPGAIAGTPARVGRFLIVPENHELSNGRWRVVLIDSDGARLKPVQELPVAGWSWGTPAASGSVAWAVGDRGGATAYALGSYEQRDPFRPIARINPESGSSGPAFAEARSETELWLSSGRSARLELSPERGTIKPAWTLGEAGPAIAPPQAAGGLVVLTQQATEGPGVALWGVVPQSGRVRWRTVLGAPWPAPLLAAAAGHGLTSLGPDGAPLAIPEDRLAEGGFVEATIPGPGRFRLPPGPIGRLEAGAHTVLVPPPGSRSLMVRAGDGGFRKVALPAPLGGAPRFWGADLLVPGDDGRAYLIDPLTGESRAEPFVPPFDRARTARWLSPAILDREAAVLVDDSGRVRRLTRPVAPRPRLVASAEVTLDRPIVSPPVAEGGAVVLATADGRIRALSARDLSPLGAWPFEVPPSLPPCAVSGVIFAADAAGRLAAIGADGRRLWSVELGAEPPLGPPVVRDGAAWFLGRSGDLRGLSLADGAPAGTARLGILPAGGPLDDGARIVLPAGSSSLRPLLRLPEADRPDRDKKEESAR